MGAGKDGTPCGASQGSRWRRQGPTGRREVPRRRATAASRFGRRRQDKREGEGEYKEDGEHGELTLSMLEGSAEAGVAGRRRSDARRAAAVGRTEAGKDGRHGRSMASLVDSLGGEEQHGEAVRLASSICSGTSFVAGDLEGTAATPCEPRARFRVWVARGKGERAWEVESGGRARHGLS